MTQRLLHPAKTLQANQITLAGWFLIGSSGAVDDQYPVTKCGVTVEKTGSETGRYTLTPQFGTIISGSCNMNGPDDSAFPTTTGSDPQMRGFDPTDQTALVYIQFKRPDTQADTNPASGTVVFFTVVITRDP